MLEVLFLTYLGVTLIIRLVQYVITYFSSYNTCRNVQFRFGGKPEHEPFVSIHLPICNEPPEVVIKTIRSLLQVEYSNYEIIVLDNNTTDVNMWKPVERFCEGKNQIKFYHIPRLSGNKAGALNRCTRYMNKQSDYILVIDADYKVIPKVLNVCVNIAELKGADLLQFPQSYRNTNRTSSLNLEYRSYFKIFMNMANRFRCVLSTGTLSFIRYRTLKSIGGWDGDTLTEDAELGVRLLTSGYKTLYVDEAVGYGLTPFDLKSLDKQRRRWVTGNIQVLTKYFRTLLESTILSLRQKAGIFLQLTAWVDYKVLALLLFSLMHLMGISRGVMMVFWGYFITMVVLKVLIYKRTFKGISLRKSLRIFSINQSLIIASGLSWLRAFFPLDLTFEVTGKQRTESATRPYLESNITGMLVYTLMILFSLSQDVLSSILIAVVVILQIWSRNHTKNYFKKLDTRNT